MSATIKRGRAKGNRVLSGMPHKRPRRHRATKQEMIERRTAVLSIVQEMHPASCRQAFYQATVRGFTEKTENGYDKVQGAITWLRRNGACPYDWIGDATRWMRKPDTYTHIEAALRYTIDTYRRAVWRDQDVYVEIWLEKDALAGTIIPVTAEYDVPLMVARGYSSLTFLYSAGEAIAANDKPAYIYHLGDWDPSGQNAADHIERQLREFAPDVPIYFERLAVTEQQILDLNLPTRPTKKSDSRAKNWRAIASRWTPSLPTRCDASCVMRSSVISTSAPSTPLKQRRSPNAHSQRLGSSA
jgi:hypothetical protein